MKTEPNEPINVLMEQNAGHMYAASFGLTKREYFAAMAMSTLDLKSIFLDDLEGVIAKSSVKIADALIKELNKENK